MPSKKHPKGYDTSRRHPVPPETTEGVPGFPENQPSPPSDDTSRRNPVPPTVVKEPLVSKSRVSKVSQGFVQSLDKSELDNVLEEHKQVDSAEAKPANAIVVDEHQDNDIVRVTAKTYLYSRSTAISSIVRALNTNVRLVVLSRGLWMHVRLQSEPKTTGYVLASFTKDI